MISPLPVISLILPLFSRFSRKSSTVSKKSDFKHYKDPSDWEPMKSTPEPEHICMSPERCPFEAHDDSTSKSEHVCVAQNGCLYNH